MKRTYNGLILCGALATTLAFAETRDVAVSIPSGANFILEVGEDETFFEVAEKVGDYIGDGRLAKEILFEVQLDEESLIADEQYEPVMWAYRGVPRLATASIGFQPRDFYEPLTEDHKNDIRLIVTTLANKTLPKIFMQQGALERAGQRIDRVHPLRFLEYIFSDEALKTGMHSIRSKGRIWKNFYEGLRDSLEAEANSMNMKDEYVNEFATSVNIGTNLLLPLVHEKKWHEFFDTLLAQIPRSKDHNRYDS